MPWEGRMCVILQSRFELVSLLLFRIFVCKKIVYLRELKKRIRFVFILLLLGRFELVKLRSLISLSKQRTSYFHRIQPRVYNYIAAFSQFNKLPEKYNSQYNSKKTSPSTFHKSSLGKVGRRTRVKKWRRRSRLIQREILNDTRRRLLYTTIQPCVQRGDSTLSNRIHVRTHLFSRDGTRMMENRGGGGG